MPNIATVLKSEIARIARKEVRGEVESLRKASNTYRSDIAALKRRVASLEQVIRKSRVTQASAPPAASADVPPKGLRFSAKGLASQRARLGLSAEDCGLLLGTSGQSIYNWEAGKARPKVAYLPAIVALRNLGKKAALAALSSIKPAG